MVLALSLRAGDNRGEYIAHPASERVGGELVVSFRPGVSQGQRDAILQGHGATIAREMSIPGYVVVTMPDDQREAIGQALAESGAVQTAEDIVIRQPAVAPNDTYYNHQWNFQDIGYASAREISDGSGVLVGVLDTGAAWQVCDENGKLYGKAPELMGVEFIAAYDAYNPGRHCTASDDYGHGSHVTGTIVQTTDNAYGAAGLAPATAIMPVKICGPDPTPVQPYGCPTDRIADGINYAVANGARVINLSIGGGEGFITQAERTALSNARQAGVVVIAAAGNGGKSVLDYPAAVDTVISVGAVGVLHVRASYSNYGQGEGGRNLDLVAPGGDTATEGSISVILQQTYGTCSGATDFTFFPEVTPCQGTSMAAAHVTGVAALIKSKFPTLSVPQVRAVLNCSAEDLGIAGYDSQHGNGLVRADRALMDIDFDGLPDCIDTTTPTPPANQCAIGSLTPGATIASSIIPQGPPPTDTDTPTPTPTETETPTPTPSDSGSPTDSGGPTETGSPTASGAPTESDSPTESPAPSETPTATPTPIPTASPSPTPAPGCGDVDCSGAVDGADALGVLLWLAQAGSPACIGLGYVNCDGQLNAADVVTILRFAGSLPLNLPAGCAGIG